MQSRELSVEVKPIILRLEREEIHQRQKGGEKERERETDRIQPDAARLIRHVFPVQLDHHQNIVQPFNSLFIGRLLKFEKKNTRKWSQHAKWNILQSQDLAFHRLKIKKNN